MKTYAARKDANDAPLTLTALRLGAFILHMEPGQGFDWLLFHRGRVLIVEIKDGTKMPSQRQLTETEKTCQSICVSHKVPYHIVESEQDLLDLLTT